MSRNCMCSPIRSVYRCLSRGRSFMGGNLCLLLLGCLLTACSNQASHLPLPHEIPGAVVINTVDNLFYDARRHKVKSFIRCHYQQLKQQVTLGEGVQLKHLYSLAKIKRNQGVLLKELQNPQWAYFTADQLDESTLEKVTVTVMVHGE